MRRYMSHYNENLLCAIDVETTGLDPRIHEIVQVAILPLDIFFNPLQDVLPFNILIKPIRVNCIDHKAMKVNKLSLRRLCRDGMSYEMSHDLFDRWMKQLDLRPHADGQPRQIMPLGHNYQFDKSFLIQWLGLETYNTNFHWHIRDTMASALFLKDRFSLFMHKDPLPKVNLSYLCACLKIKRVRSHDALCDCVDTAKVYQKMTKMFAPNQTFSDPRVTEILEILDSGNIDAAEFLKELKAQPKT